MPFQPGNKLSPGGKKGNPGGRKSKEVKANNQKAEEIARAYIEKWVKPVLETYGKVSHGYTVKRRVTKPNGDVHEYDEFVYDAQVLKHYMDRVIPARAPEDKQGRALVPVKYVTNLTESDD